MVLHPMARGLIRKGDSHMSMEAEVEVMGPQEFWQHQQLQDSHRTDSSLEH